MENENGWDEWKNHVLKTQDQLVEKVDQLIQDMASVKAAAKLWGAVMALIVSPIVVGVVLAVIAAFN